MNDEVSRQCFWSYALTTQGAGLNADSVAHLLPALSDSPRLLEIGGMRVCLFQPDGNALYRHWMYADRAASGFVIGEFYQPPDFDGIERELKKEEGVAKAVRFAANELNGVFSGVFADRRNETVYCFSDRFGFGRQYSARRNGGIVVASHLWPWLGAATGNEAIDEQALEDILLHGYPLEDLTPVAGVRATGPGQIREYEKDHETIYPYVPPRRSVQVGPTDAIEQALSAFGSHFNDIEELTGCEEYSLAMSGGHDSRVVLNALLQQGRIPKCVVGFKGQPIRDTKRAISAARSVGCSTTVVDYEQTTDGDRAEVAVLVDGSSTGGWAMNLAKSAVGASEAIWFGTSGDLLSGGWSFDPWRIRSRGELCEAILSKYNYEYAMPLDAFARIFRGRSSADLINRLCSTLPTDTGSYKEAYLEHRIATRNFRRIGMFMQGAGLYMPAVHPFHDTRISEFYLSLPQALLRGQALHARLCSTARRTLAWLPASNYPVPVGVEPYVLPIARRVVDPLRRFTKTFKRSRGGVEPESEAIDIIRDSGFGLRIDVNSLSDAISTDPRGALIRLRVNYIANMLYPQRVIEASRLLGYRRVGREYERVTRERGRAHS